MVLLPYADPVYRREKIVRHWFHPPERWWEVTHGDLDRWLQGWNAVRVAGGFQPLGWLDIQEDSPAGRAIAEAHDLWIQAARRAMEQAACRHTVYPTEDWRRTVYVGQGGVVVVTASQQLVTCFRPAMGVTDVSERDARSVLRYADRSRAMDRRAVRNQARLALHLARNPHG